MFNEINHQYSALKNKTMNWLGHDNIVVHYDNLKKYSNDKVKYNWDEQAITYKFNSHGFRCDEFSNEDNIMFLGCSNTMGMALPLEDTWPYNVAKNLNLKSVNLSIPGTGPDTAFRMANHYIPQIKPKIVVYLDPPPGRFSLISGKKQIYDFTVFKSELIIDPMFKEYYKHWLSIEENITLNSLKHKLAIQGLCQEYNAKFVFAENKELKFIDYARDMLHPGINSNLEFSKFILNNLSKNS
jgi:hypothetical protein